MVHNQVPVSATPTSQIADFDQERERIRQEYEAKLSQLTMQYTAEQQTSAQLQDELKKTREAYEQQIAALNDISPPTITPQVTMASIILLLIMYHHGSKILILKNTSRKIFIAPLKFYHNF